MLWLGEAPRCKCGKGICGSPLDHPSNISPTTTCAASKAARSATKPWAVGGFSGGSPIPSIFIKDVEDCKPLAFTTKLSIFDSTQSEQEDCFPQKINITFYLHATGQQGHHNLWMGGGVIPAVQLSEIHTVMWLEITRPLLNLGTEVSARTKRLQSHPLMLLRPLFWHTNPLVKISAHT